VVSDLRQKPIGLGLVVQKAIFTQATVQVLLFFIKIASQKIIITKTCDKPAPSHTSFLFSTREKDRKTNVTKRITFYPKSIEKTKHIFMTINMFFCKNIFTSQIVITIMFFLL